MASHRQAKPGDFGACPQTEEESGPLWSAREDRRHPGILSDRRDYRGFVLID